MARLTISGIVVDQEQLSTIRRVLVKLRHGTNNGHKCWCPTGMSGYHHDSCVDASILFHDLTKILSSTEEFVP